MTYLTGAESDLLPETKAFAEELRLEGTSSRWLSNPGFFWASVNFYDQWLRTQNPFFVDGILEAISLGDGPFTMSFKRVLFIASALRTEGSAKGTWKQVLQWDAHNRAFEMMADLIRSGLNDEQAAMRAAAWVDKFTDGRVTPKASSLQKKYFKEFRKTGKEQLVLKNRDGFYDWWSEDRHESERRNALSLPTVSKHLTGTRR